MQTRHIKERTNEPKYLTNTNCWYHRDTRSGRGVANSINLLILVAVEKACFLEVVMPVEGPRCKLAWGHRIRSPGFRCAALAPIGISTLVITSWLASQLAIPTLTSRVFCPGIGSTVTNFTAIKQRVLDATLNDRPLSISTSQCRSGKEEL